MLEDQAVDDVEPRLRAVGLGDRDGPAELDDRRAGEAGELAIEGGDLGQVAGLVGVQRRDRRLQDVGPAPVQRERPVERRAPGGDLRGVPQRAVLVGEQYELVAVALAARRASCSSIIASRPCTSGSSGISSASARPSRIASAASSLRAGGAE